MTTTQKVIDKPVEQTVFGTGFIFDWRPVSLFVDTYATEHRSLTADDKQKVVQQQCSECNGRGDQNGTNDTADAVFL